MSAAPLSCTAGRLRAQDGAHLRGVNNLLKAGAVGRGNVQGMQVKEAGQRRELAVRRQPCAIDACGWEHLSGQEQPSGRVPLGLTQACSFHRRLVLRIRCAH